MNKFSSYSSVRVLEQRKTPSALLKIMIRIVPVLIIVLCLPWTQTISSPGNVTALNPNNRPQTIQAVIGGRIEKWYVQEGDFVKKGDTIVFLSEVKAEYMDPELVKRTEEQIKAKESSADSYMSKVRALDNQIDALIDGRILKLQQAANKVKQARFKVVSDSMDYKASAKQLEIAVEQYERIQKLYKEDIRSLTDVENRRLKVQEMEAKVVSLENKLLISRNELINAQTDLATINAEYQDKIAKSESEKSSALSSLYDVEAQVSQKQNDLTNYEIRAGYYVVRAPQDGFISKALKSGVGENVKEGTPLVSIVPNLTDYAVEIYAEPVDLPLVHKGEKVRLQFDGWPAIVFSGWPNVSYGTYGGVIVAIDNHISENGKYRILVAPDKNDHPWPSALRMGVAVKSMTLLNDVPILYELWRNINGFPPNYYTPKTTKTTKEKK